MNALERFSLEGKTILLTGGCGLLGRYFAKTLASAGVRVLVSGRNEAACSALAEPLGGLGMELDVADRQSVANAFSRLADAGERLDGLVNLASFSAPAAADSEASNNDGYDPEMFVRSLQVDLAGTFFCCTEAARIMSAQGSGSIVNVSSIYGERAPDQSIYEDIVNSDGTPFVKPPGYGAAKAGLANLTQYLAGRLGRDGVRVNALVLGGVEDGQNPGFVRRYSERTALGRMARPEDYGAALVFLLSEAASYMTGARLVLDGGWTSF
ncbi:MAG: SDR family oxidoreductase [Desulfovibrionaceae bacterium]